MKNICLLIYSLRSGGAEHVISQWSQLLAEDFNVYMTIFDADGINYPYSGELINLNVPSNNKTVLSKTRIVLKRAQKLKRFVNEKKIDIVISFCNECNLVNTISAHNAVKVCSIRSAKDLYANRFVKITMKSKSNNIIVQTKKIKSAVLEDFGEDAYNRTTVFGNPFNSDFIIALSNEPLDDKNMDSVYASHKTAVFVGSFKPQKNHAHLLKAFEYLFFLNKELVLVLLGADNGEKKNVIEMIKNSKYKDRIYLLDEKKNPYPYMKRSDVFVLPSLFEGIPNVVAESMICGTPVIAVNCPTGPAELLSREGNDDVTLSSDYIEVDYGILVKPFSGATDYSYDNISAEDKAFAHAVLYALHDNETYERLVRKTIEGSKKFDIMKYKTLLKSMIMNYIDGGL